ncbi:DUF2066 domain-containing protein [Aestuariivirga sp.]|uniref:DUF2066 domain-containing protein n=1 Tax=Aestuariivirga sp. TaxID=2650926 RepID=UPI00391AFA0D
MDPTGFSRRALLALGGALALRGTPLFAQDRLANLYQARTIVTGRRPETRIPGMASCLAQVLVRVSGDPRLAERPELARLAQTPEAPVKTYSYRDLYAFRPIRDEQGTRDRPYEMTVEYVPEKVNDLLSALGSRPWLEERPRLVVFLAVRHIASSFVLTSMAGAGDLMRESFRDASWAHALEVVIPSDLQVAKAGLTVDGLPEVQASALEPLVDRNAGQIPLLGSLAWSKELLAWRAEWRLDWRGREHRWSIEGVNFDAAFRNGVGGAAQIFSGNGEPG